jgi:hypothetical protein
MAGGTIVQRNAHSSARLGTLTISVLAFVLSGCLESEESAGGFVEPGTTAENRAPTISGVPASKVTVGDMYSFTPNATDADGDKLTFWVDNKPGWASFDSSNGKLSGQPSLGSVGTHSNVRISVSDGEATTSLAAFSITVEEDPATGGNRAPTISGNPARTVTVGDNYAFTPGASDADGDTLTFSIQNPPGWASFNTNTGQLSGRPAEAHIGVYENILIAVSDGQDSASLSPFSVTVDQNGTVSTTLTWTPPTENEDGTALTDLAGYKLYWGTTPGVYTDSVTINNPGLSSYVVENLQPGTYEFVATAFNDAGVESSYSNPTTKVLNQ